MKTKLPKEEQHQTIQKDAQRMKIIVIMQRLIVLNTFKEKR